MNEPIKTVIRSVIAGCGSALPQRVMTNADMSKIVDTSDEWIVERTGIKARHFTEPGMPGSLSWRRASPVTLIAPAVAPW